MRKGIAIALLVAVLAAAAGYWYRYPLVEFFTGGEAEAFRQAEKLIAEGKPAAALNWLGTFSRELHEKGPMAEKWRSLYLTAAVDAKDGGALVVLYEGDPRIVEGNEAANLILAERLIRMTRTQDYVRLRETWVGNETQPEKWFNLDADLKLIQGDRTGAITLLNSKSFEGKADTGRLVRLALLTVKDKPREAWEYLARAFTKDPANSEIRSYRARLLEVVGQTGLALNEYVAAAQLSPDEVFYQDQLAEFYRRNNRYDLAIDVWKTQLQHAPSEVLWLKAWFWTRMLAPSGATWTDQPIPKGSMEPFLNYLANLKPGTFWKEEAFDQIPNSQTYLQSQQVTFWLRLLDSLQKNNEERAWELLQYNVFAAQSWNAALENLVRKVLTYRKIGTFNIDVLAAEPVYGVNPSDPKSEKSQVHPLLVEVNALSAKGADVLKISDGLREVLTSRFAIPSCFLVSGWFGAALDLTSQPINIPADSPEWLAFNYAQAIRNVKGVGPALEFAQKQAKTPPISLLIGELLYANGKQDEGAEYLRQLSSLDSEIGVRASWLLSLHYSDRKQYDQARAVILAQPTLSKDTLGLETLARISMVEGNLEDAEKRYTEIQDKSWEAKSFLARKAYADKDYQKASLLTEDLLRQFPNNSVLRQNYLRIQEELKGSSGKGEPRDTNE